MFLAQFFVRYFLFLLRGDQKYPIWVGSGLLRYILRLTTGCSSMHTLSCKASYKSEYFAFLNLYFDVCFGTGSRAEKSCKYHKLGYVTILECQVHLDQICMLIKCSRNYFSWPVLRNCSRNCSQERFQETYYAGPPCWRTFSLMI